jgi:hypothetical protein
MKKAAISSPVKHFSGFTPVKQLQVLQGTALRHLRQARQA